MQQVLHIEANYIYCCATSNVASPMETPMTMSETGGSTAQGQALLDRLDRLEPGRPHRKLMFQGGLGYAFDSFDGASWGTRSRP